MGFNFDIIFDSYIEKADSHSMLSAFSATAILICLTIPEIANSQELKTMGLEWALYDKDPALSDLFDRSGESQLCFQTSFAQKSGFQK